MADYGGTPRTGFHHQVLYTLVLAVLYAGSFGLVMFVLNPLQAMLFPEVTMYASLAFLPHGLRVMATVVMGARAIPGLFLGSLYSAYFLWGIHSPASAVLVSIISASVAWVTFEGLKAFHIDAYYLSRQSKMPSFQTILLAGVICSFLNAFLMSAIFEITGSIENVTLTLAALAIGDMVGLIAAWLLAKSVVRFSSQPL